jgi:hypothetical protein
MATVERRFGIQGDKRCLYEEIGCLVGSRS